MPKRKRATYLFYPFLPIAGIAVMLALLELSLRIIAWNRPYDASPEWTWGHRVINNRFGFREREFAVPKGPNTYRIMVLGDSLTWGAGLGVEQRYSNLLESQLRKIFTEKDIEVLNFGRAGASTTVELDLLRKHIDLVQPDLIIVGFCFNDVQPRGQNYAIELEKYRPIFDVIKGLTHLQLRDTAIFLNRKFDGFLRNAGFVPDWQTALDRAYDPVSPLWQEFHKTMYEIKGLSDARGLPSPIFIPLLGGSGDFSKPDPWLANLLKWNQLASQVAQQAGMQVASLEEAFKRQGRKNRAVNPWDDHPSAECNQIFAEKLAPLVSSVIASRIRKQ